MADDRSEPGEHYCRNCGVRLRRVLGRWWHTQSLGPVRCDRPEPEESQRPFAE